MPPGIDRISELPESLVSQILAHLPTKDSVKTSALSTRWKSHWLKAPAIDLTYSDLKSEVVFISFIDRFLESNSESRLRKFKHLDVESSDYYIEPEDGSYPIIEIMPLNLYTSKTLVSLKLSLSGLQDCGFVSLPCLRFMDLVDVHWVDPMNLEKLLSGCPVLEELTLLRDLYFEPLVTRVRSRSLKKLGDCCFRSGKEFDAPEYRMEIDAPGLEFLSLTENHFDRIVVKNLTCLFTIDLDVESCLSFSPEDLSKRNEVRDFLAGVSSARHMIISEKTVKALDVYSKVGLIPKFNNLSCLQAVFPSSSLQFLPSFLESFPNLKHLILKVVYSKESCAFELLNVPRCFLSILECVEIKGFFDWDEEEMKITSYFLENSKVLKKLILSFAGCPLHYSESEVYEEIRKLTKGCEVIIDSEF
ncbi:unnamed protein product [Microthlaspi erraticum]|uniref:F-box domain-containing protein n=1 Tax=Microthlaspi erraticum TaxID=1685480 RepID=A0A6D2IMN9_9BRAS|nr:unnamed protein product [Microthlaspi erraticum]